MTRSSRSPLRTGRTPAAKSSAAGVSPASQISGLSPLTEGVFAELVYERDPALIGVTTTGYTNLGPTLDFTTTIPESTVILRWGCDIFLHTSDNNDAHVFMSWRLTRLSDSVILFDANDGRACRFMVGGFHTGAGSAIRSRGEADVMSSIPFLLERAGDYRIECFYRRVDNTAVDTSVRYRWLEVSFKKQLTLPPVT